MTTPEAQDPHDGLTHLVNADDAEVTACGIERTIWVSATQQALFASCEECRSAGNA